MLRKLALVSLALLSDILAVRIGQNATAAVEDADALDIELDDLDSVELAAGDGSKNYGYGCGCACNSVPNYVSQDYKACKKSTCGSTNSY
jgi:hypothetical protein